MPYQHIGQIDRQLVSEVQRRKLDRAWIGRLTSKHRASIGRELKRNADQDGHYNSFHAHARAKARRRRPRGRKIDKNPVLRQYVLEKLALRWSPQQISQRLRLDHPDDPAMRISHQAVYDFIEQDRRLGEDSECGGQLFGQLRRRKKRYRKHRTKAGRSHIPDRVGIEQRPVEAATRQDAGHLEGDTVHGHKTNACLTTLVERKTRITRIRRCPNRRARTVTHAAADALLTLPSLCVRTVTFDNGSEFAQHAELTRQTGVQTFFASPYSSWERGSNENMNGLIRDFFPKRTNFSRVSDAEVARVEDLLNNRPRKCLGWRTPNEALARKWRLRLEVESARSGP